MWLVRLNAWLSALGKVATTIYCGVIAALVIGVDLRPTRAGSALNSGRPIEHAFVLAILLPDGGLPARPVDARLGALEGAAGAVAP